MKPLTRSHDRVHLGEVRRWTRPAGFETLGPASLPAISRIVVASEDGPAASCTSADTTSVE